MISLKQIQIILQIKINYHKEEILVNEYFVEEVIVELEMNFHYYSILKLYFLYKFS